MRHVVHFAVERHCARAGRKGPDDAPRQRHFGIARRERLIDHRDLVWMDGKTAGESIVARGFARKAQAVGILVIDVDRVDGL